MPIMCPGGSQSPRLISPKLHGRKYFSEECDGTVMGNPAPIFYFFFLKILSLIFLRGLISLTRLSFGSEIAVAMHATKSTLVVLLKDSMAC